MKQQSISIDRALILIRDIQPSCMNSGYYIALAGGVLNNGYSKSDIDLVAMPMSDEKSTSDTLLQYLNRRFIYVSTCRVRSATLVEYLTGEGFKLELAIVD